MARTGSLGELELAVLDCLWERGAGDVKAVHGSIGVARRITANTVQSTLKRLHAKGLLARRKVSHAYVYEPALDRAAFHRDVLDDVIRSMHMDGEPDALLAAFVDLTERVGAEQLRRLEGLVASRLAEQQPDG